MQINEKNMRVMDENKLARLLRHSRSSFFLQQTVTTERWLLDNEYLNYSQRSKEVELYELPQGVWAEPRLPQQFFLYFKCSG